MDGERIEMTAVLVLRRHPMLLIVPAVLFAAAVAGDALTTGPVLCFHRLTTGIPCPGCGLTRGFVALMHGHLRGALHYNPLTPVVLSWMAIWWCFAVAALLRGRAIPRIPGPLLRIAFGVLLSFWVLRAGLFLALPDAWEQMRAVALPLRIASFLFG
ncbi:MAG: DUF2752 domain-containing protein [Deltaproteobacteria bacterium]|nr:DUF2752 domain-containing protein [Deltaproteobacteria bacterium]